MLCAESDAPPRKKSRPSTTKAGGTVTDAAVSEEPLTRVDPSLYRRQADGKFFKYYRI